MGREEGECDPCPRPQLPAAQMTAERRRDHRHGEPSGEQQQADLVEQSDAEESAENEPEPGLSAGDEPDQQPEAQRPEEQVEGVHRVVAEDAEQLGHDGNREPSEPLRGPAAAQLSRQPCGEQDQAAVEQRRQQADGEDAVTEQRAHAGEHGDRQRRLVDVAPGKMVGAGEVVELVAKEPVARAGPELERGDAEGEREDLGRAEAKGRPRA